MKNLQHKSSTSNLAKKTYTSPRVEQVQLDQEISMVMMSTPPIEGLPQQDPLMSLKGFKLFK